MNDISNNSIGKITIADNVAATIASIAAQEVPEIINVTGSTTSSITEFFGKKNFSKGVKISTEEEGSIVIDLSLVIRHGVNILNVAKNVQENVKEAVENQAGIKVTEVNITISDIVFDDKIIKEKNKE